MPCLIHLQCSGCCSSYDTTKAYGPASAVLVQPRRPPPLSAGWSKASYCVTQRALSIRAVQATAEPPCLAERPQRPSCADPVMPPEPQSQGSPEAPVARERLQTRLPSAPLTSASDRAPPPQHHVYWKGSVTSREAVLGRRLLGSHIKASVASVLQGEMLSSKQITRLLSWLGNEGHPDRALEVFDWLEGRREYVTEVCILYTRLASMFARQRGGLETAMHIFDCMRARGIPADTVAFNSAITVASKAGDWQKVLQLSSDMQRSGVQPDVWTYASLIAACQSCGNRWREALAFYQDMQDKGLAGNVVLYTTLMTVCHKGGQPERAVRIFRAMEGEGLQADVVAYNQAMASCSWEKAWACFHAMRRAGVQPNTRSYNALLAACERDGEADRALEAFARMEREAPGSYGYSEPDLVTFNTLISACGKAGKYLEALQALAKMRSLGISPDTVTVSCLIRAASKAGQLGAALEHYQQFCDAGGVPSMATYNALILALGQGGEWQRALSIFQDLRLRSSLEADALPSASRLEGQNADTIRLPGSLERLGPRTWGAVIAACYGNKQWSKTLELWSEMRALGARPDSYLLQKVISACEKVGAWEEADMLFQEMQEQGLLRNMDSLALATRKVLYALPTLVAGPLMTSGHLALDSGRAARRWIQRNSPTMAEDVDSYS